MSVAKFPGHDNGADLMTKYKGRSDTLRLLSRIGFTRLAGRPESAPKRTTTWDVGQPISPPREDPNEMDQLDTNSCDTITGDDSHQSILQSMMLHSTRLEGKLLCSDQQVPHRGSRILMSVQDLHTGDEVFKYRGPIPDEPDLFSLVDSKDSRPLFLVTWAINILNPTGPS